MKQGKNWQEPFHRSIIAK